MSKLAMKFRVRDSGHSAEIQKQLFALGYTWNCGADVVRYTDKRFLYAESNGTILHGSFESSFESDEAKEFDTGLVEVVRCFVVDGKKMTLAEVKKFINEQEDK